MRRIIIGLVIGGILGGVGGFGAGIFVYPFWFLSDVATETVADLDRKTVVATGEFIHANPNDPVHYGRGGVTVYEDQGGEQLVHLEMDFEVGPGPAFHVYLVDHPEVRARGHVNDSKFVDLGRLKAFKGSQTYTVPHGLSALDYASVVIWCKEFGVLISPAAIARA
ncbi:MAG: DM13 domain-containing protein [Alphaproteobacteria bacterium]